MDLTCEDIKIFVEKNTKVNLSRKDRKKHFVDARNIYYYLCYKYIPGVTYDRIGKEVSKNHATVMHGLEKIQWELSSNLTMNKDVINLYQKLEKELLKDNKDQSLEDRIIKLEEQLKKIQHDLSA